MITIVPNTTKCYAVVVVKEQDKYSWHYEVAINSWVVYYDKETGESSSSPVIIGLPANNQTVWVVDPSGIVHSFDEMYETYSLFAANELGGSL